MGWLVLDDGQRGEQGQEAGDANVGYPPAEPPHASNLVRFGTGRHTADSTGRVTQPVKGRSRAREERTGPRGPPGSQVKVRGHYRIPPVQTGHNAYR